MVISKKFDYRTRKKREIFFGLPFLPLFVFLLLIVVLLIIPQGTFFAANQKAPAQRIPIQIAQVYPITGEVTSGLNLTKTNYEPGKDLQGNFVIRFYPSDLIPGNSSATFSITSIKCNHSYVCSGGDVIKWQVYNKTLARCVNVSTWTDGPWEECLEFYTVYSCASNNKICCPVNQGTGNFYPNLNCSQGKECWDKCSGTITKNLVSLVMLSNSPHNGNYTNGNYKNANNSSQQFVPLSGYGFGYCYSRGGGIALPYAVYEQDYVTGYQVSEAPGAPGFPSGTGPGGPDLAVTNIYVTGGGVQPPGASGTGMAAGASGAGSSPGQKVYATIDNIGTTEISKPFVLLACWNLPSQNFVLPECDERGNLISVPSNCKNYTFNPMIGLLPYNFEINALDNIRNNLISVWADYCNVISESNENNNNKMGYVGCYDPDSLIGMTGEIYTKGTCTDLNGPHDDYCNEDMDPPRLIEMQCSPTIPGGLSSCIESPIDCPTGFTCQDGACKGGVQPACQDTDNDTINNPNPFVKGICSEMGMLPFSIPDQCIDSKILQEYNCNSNGKCESMSIDCSGYARVCLDGACVLPPKPDLIIDKIERTSDFKKAKVWIKNIGNGNVTQAFNLLINISTGTSVTTEIHTINTPLGPGNSYAQPSNKIIEGISVTVLAYADINNSIDEQNESNNFRSALLLPYSCENWSNMNVYFVSLNNLGLKAPDNEGTYQVSSSFGYGNLVFSKDSVIITVVKPVVYHYKGCLDNECITKNSTSPRNDTCDTDSDCRGVGGCNEMWQYTNFSECIGGQKIRECYDVNQCNTTYAKPSFCLQVGNRFIETQNCCESSWSCDEWSACYEHQGALIQSMTCNDVNRCSAQNLSYTQLRDCCSEEWTCNWGPCINGLETQYCQEVSNCGTNFTKPQEQTRGCKAAGKGIAWWIVLIIIFAVIIVSVVVLFATGVIKFPKKGKAEAGGVVEEAGAYPELTNYVKSAVTAGMSKDEIKRKLVETGWPEDAVDSELKKF